jgi:plasmid maintenance system antidote protein VapI
MLFEAALGINADFWLNMQKKYEKDLVALDAKFMKHLAEIRKLVAML